MLQAVAFHLAIPVNDIESTRTFYTELLGCQVGRAAERWIDFNFFGHQVSAHVKPDETEPVTTNPVDGESVPVRHFGMVLTWEAWHALVKRLDEQHVTYLIPPTTRFEGQVGEQATLFITDPSNNVLEFKSFRQPGQLFATT